MSELTIRRVAGSDEYPELVAIWRGAVDATHDFISVSDREEIEARLRDPANPGDRAQQCLYPER